VGRRPRLDDEDLVRFAVVEPPFRRTEAVELAARNQELGELRLLDHRHPFRVWCHPFRLGDNPFRVALRVVPRIVPVHRAPSFAQEREV
jgi:hypothetical protein